MCRFPEVSAGQIVPTTVTTLKANPNIKYVVFVTSSFGDGIQCPGSMPRA